MQRKRVIESFKFLNEIKDMCKKHDKCNLCPYFDYWSKCFLRDLPKFWELNRLEKDFNERGG
jgi:hypothetical protein